MDPVAFDLKNAGGGAGTPGGIAVMAHPPIVPGKESVEFFKALVEYSDALALADRTNSHSMGYI